MSPLRRIRNLTVIAATAFAALAASTVTVPLALAAGTFPNATIAQDGLQHVGQNGGQCIAFAFNMVRQASGGTIVVPGTMASNGGYYESYVSAGAQAQSVASAQEGDIIQLYKASDQKNYYSGMHTAIVVSNQGGGTFDVVDSNWNWDQIVRHHVWTNVPAYASSHGLALAIWRFGSVRAQHAYVALIPHSGATGYTVDGYGNLQPFGAAPAVTHPSPLWPGWDIVRGIVLMPDSTPSAVRGYVLDGWGGIHPFAGGNATPPPTPTQRAYWQGFDIARGIVLRGNTGTGYVLDGWGGIHPFAPAGVALPATPAVSAYWQGWDIARAIVLATASSGYVLDGYGGIHPFGGAPAVSNPSYWPGWDIARGITLATPTSGYLLDGYGGIHPFGGAPAVSSPGYSPGNDVFRAIAFDPSHGYGADVTDLTGTPYAWHT